MSREFLYGAIVDNFSLDEVKSLAFILGIDLDNADSQSKPGLVRYLILQCQANSRLDALIAVCSKARTNVDWALAYYEPDMAGEGAPATALETRRGCYFYLGPLRAAYILGLVLLGCSSIFLPDLAIVSYLCNGDCPSDTGPVSWLVFLILMTLMLVFAPAFFWLTRPRGLLKVTSLWVRLRQRIGV